MKTGDKKTARTKTFAVNVEKLSCESLRFPAKSPAASAIFLLKVYYVVHVTVSKCNPQK